MRFILRRGKTPQASLELTGQGPRVGVNPLGKINKFLRQRRSQKIAKAGSPRNRAPDLTLLRTTAGYGGVKLPSSRRFR
jgi:hypothetical protein